MTQLSMFKRKKAPPSLEFPVHCMIADLLLWAIQPGWLWMHYPSGEKRPKATAGRLKRMGVKAGVSDFLLIAPPYGKFHALELKRQGRRPTDAQNDFILAVVMAGGKADWCDNYRDAVRILTGWGAIRAVVS